jgi:hypothetical protein
MLALIGTAAAAAAALPIIASGASSAPTLPDLVSQPPVGPYTQVYSDGRLLLRFDGYVANAAGAGALEIRSSKPDAQDRMQTVRQWAGMPGPGAGGSPVAPPAGSAGPKVQFESADGHNHYHLKYAAEYSLWNADETAQVALAQKTEAGFCLEDSLQLDGSETPIGFPGYSAGANNFCWLGHIDENGHDTRTTPGQVLVEGISPGFKDLYSSQLSYQWVDISNVQPGNYQLAARVDPTNVIAESNEGNNGYQFLPYTISGYTARPVSEPQTGGPRTVTLAADAFGSPAGPLRYVIRSAPKHGTLSAAVGAVLTSPTVTYTPKAGYSGTDSFTFAAVASGFNYPITPAEATATIAGDTVAVGISGAPATMVAGTSVQLSAAVTSAPGGVAWSTDAGKISSTGLYTAPASPPAGGTATVTATSDENPEVSGKAGITITKAGKGKPAPGGVISMAAGNKLLSPLKIGRIGKRTIVGKVVTGPRAGKVVFTTTFRSKVLGRCVIKSKARRVLTCRVTLKRSYPLKKVRVTVRFTAKGGKTAVRRSFVVR